MNQWTKRLTTLAIMVAWGASAASVLAGPPVATWDSCESARQWQPVTVRVEGPMTSETAEPNPFTDYRLDVTFSCGDASYVVPGYYAADGNAAETGAEEGNIWLVKFVPDRPGTWQYEVRFVEGEDVATAPATDGKPLDGDGAKGEFEVAAVPEDAPGYYAQGKLRYVGKRYLQFAGSGEYYLKGGADSPENFLGYVDFDGTYKAVGEKGEKQRSGEALSKGLHTYAPHEKDWSEGDPTWRDGKGKGIIGALNYLASEGMNSVYFVTMNVQGDGKDVWPWTAPDQRVRFDCSKLAQWDIVFDHMDRNGLALHVVTQETENDQLLDGGDLGPDRKLYYRELVARFAHHLAVVWNLGEENTNTTAQQKAFCEYIDAIDAYDNAIVVHTYPNQKEKVYRPLVGYPKLDGLSLQFSDDWVKIPEETLKWVTASQKSGKPWVVCIDEPGTASLGVDPDSKPAPENNQPLARRTALWGALMAGGGGVEWYFGYKNPHNDLNCEDWRSRDRLWDVTRYALEFFQGSLPFEEMSPRDGLVEGEKAQCLAKPGAVYAIYLPHGGEAQVDLSQEQGTWTARWFNPRTGKFLDASVSLEAGKKVALDTAPVEPLEDWAILISK